MLVLSRKNGESIYISDIKVTVVQLDGNRVKIGIEAPPEVRILRGELVCEMLFAPEPLVEPVLGADDPASVCSIDS